MLEDALQALAEMTNNCEVWEGLGKREFDCPWREAGPPNHHDDNVDSDQYVVDE